VALQLRGWVWAPAELDGLLNTPPVLLPAQSDRLSSREAVGPFSQLVLNDDDGTDPLLLVITPQLQVALMVDGPSGGRRLVARFEPAVLSAALGLVHQRLERSDAAAAADLRQHLQGLGALHSDADVALRFWARLATRLAAMAPSVTLQPLVAADRPQDSAAASTELALLEAITHEVRTPLATIRTLIRSLLRRSDIPAVVRQRLEQIDGECSEQIDRFGLIFLAAELHRQPQPDPSNLARTDLGTLLQQMAPLWERQLSRRGLGFQLSLSSDLPHVLSDACRLETMLGGLIDRFSRNLAAGSEVQLSLMAAGTRLKLHLHCSAATAQDGLRAEAMQQRQLVGPVLSWNPTTGSLQLSRQATQQLFEQLGGRLTERSGNGLTVFFPTC